MPSILSHPAVPLAIGLGLGQRYIPRPLLALGIAASILPDIDVLSWYLGLPASSALAHRGLTHSLLFAAIIALLCCCCWAYGRSHWQRVFAFVFISGASHGLLDTCTTGGIGVMFLWPFSDQRWTAAWRVIAVSPLNPERLADGRWVQIMFSEWLWVWLPAALLACALAGLRHWWIHHQQGQSQA